MAQIAVSVQMGREQCLSIPGNSDRSETLQWL